MSPAQPFLCGIIEGFYGRPWSQDLRLAYARYLGEAGLDPCLYAPKADPFLRRRWQEDWPQEQWLALQSLAATYRAGGVSWGPGLSPFALYQQYDGAARSALQAKIERIAALDAPLLAILFDDMPGDLDGLAERQAEIVSDIHSWLPDRRLLVCPTYYSFDPVLERFFGAMPAGYWEQLGQSLPREVEVFWTGNTVCSESVCSGDLRDITGKLGRPVVLWDNYPVNDGAVRSRHLYTAPLSGREPDIIPLLNGHLCNPMNQGILSLPALTGLAALHRRRGFSPDRLAALLGVEASAALAVDGERFQHSGLDGLDERERESLAARYGAMDGDGAVEIAAWLRGEYAFDPACLTD